MLKKSLRWASILSVSAFIFANLNSSIHAQELVYEGFDYPAGELIDFQDGGVGWSSEWIVTGPGPVFHTIGEGLSFGTLMTSGGSAVRATRDASSVTDRTISAAASTALTADNSTIWFSVLMSPSGNTAGTGSGGGIELNTFGTLMFGNDFHDPPSGASPAPTPGSGVGVGFSGPNGSATVDNVTYANMTIQGVVYNEGTLTQDVDNRIVVGGGTSLIVGRVDWAPNGSDDTLTLYNIVDPAAALPVPFSTMSVDLDQSGFNIVSIAAQQTSVFDELRFGITLADVLPTESPFILGDVNMDGTVNFLDISPFIAVLSSGGFQDEADIDRNGTVNFLDISPFIAILSAG